MEPTPHATRQRCGGTQRSTWPAEGLLARPTVRRGCGLHGGDGSSEHGSGAGAGGRAGGAGSGQEVVSAESLKERTHLARSSRERGTQMLTSGRGRVRGAPRAGAGAQHAGGTAAWPRRAGLGPGPAAGSWDPACTSLSPLLAPHLSEPDFLPQPGFPPSVLCPSSSPGDHALFKNTCFY